LQGFFANFRKGSVLVDHPSMLATHPKGAGLARVSGS
jgi:hypothetical protein